MNYAIPKANGIVLRKLHYTCKYFYPKAPYTIVDHVELTHKGKYFKVGEVQHAIVDAEHINQFNKLWIVKSIRASDTHGKKIFENLCSNMTKCDVREVNLREIRLSKAAFNAMTKAGSIRKWTTMAIRVEDSDGSFAPLEILMKHLINAQKIW